MNRYNVKYEFFLPGSTFPFQTVVYAEGKMSAMAQALNDGMNFVGCVPHKLIKCEKLED